jgi:hypothetical protein
MLNTREVLFLKTAANLKLLDQNQLAQAQEGIKQARAQNNPIFVWDLLVHWKFLPTEKAEYIVKLVLQAEKKQAGAGSSAAMPAAQPAAPPAQAVAGAAPAVPTAQPQVPSASPATQVPGAAPAILSAQPQVPGAAPAQVGVAVATDSFEAAVPKAKGSAPIGLIAAGIVLVIAAGGGAAFYFWKPAENPTEPGEAVVVASNAGTTGGEIAVNPGGPPDGPLTVAPGGPPIVTPGGPPIVTPGGPPGVTPGGPPIVTPGGPPIVTPGGPPGVTPGGPPGVTPGGPPGVTPGGPPGVTPGGPPIGIGPPLGVAPGGALTQVQVNEAGAEYEKLSSQVTELVTNKDYEKALLKLNAFKLNTTGDPVLLAKLDARIAEVNQKKNAPPPEPDEDEPALSLPGATQSSSGSEQVTKEVIAYMNIRQQLDPLLKERKFSEAKEVLGKLAEAPENELFFNFLNQLQGDLAKANEFVGKTIELLKEKVGSDLRWGGLSAKIKSVDDEKMTILSLNRDKIVPFNKIKVAEHMRVQNIKSREANTDQLFAMGLVYFCDGQYSQARKFLDETKLTHNSESYLEFMSKDSDSKALQIIRQIQEATKAKDVKALFSLTKKLRESHEQSPVTSAYNDLLIQVDEAWQKYKDERVKLVEALSAVAQKVEMKVREEHSKKNSGYMKKIAEMEKKPQMDEFSYKLIDPKNGPNTLKINKVSKPNKEIEKDEATAKSKNENLKQLEKFLRDNEKKSSLLISKSESTAKREVKRLNSEINRFERKMSTQKAKAAALHRNNISRLKSQMKKLMSRIASGDTMTEEEMGVYLRR